MRQLSTQVSDAQRELAAVREMCKQAAQRLEQSMWVAGTQRKACPLLKQLVHPHSTE